MTTGASRSPWTVFALSTVWSLRGVRSVLRAGTWYARRHPIAVTFSAPIAPEGSDWNAAVRLRDQVRAEVLKHCGERDTEA